ncbi:hypothetical protein BGW38_003279, partial [Lunasporangiospora selenospora]
VVLADTGFSDNTSLDPIYDDNSPSLDVNPEWEAKDFHDFETDESLDRSDLWFKKHHRHGHHGKHHHRHRNKHYHNKHHHHNNNNKHDHHNKHHHKHHHNKHHNKQKKCSKRYERLTITDVINGETYTRTVTAAVPQSTTAITSAQSQILLEVRPLRALLPMVVAHRFHAMVRSPSRILLEDRQSHALLPMEAAHRFHAMVQSPSRIRLTTKQLRVPTAARPGPSIAALKTIPFMTVEPVKNSTCDRNRCHQEGDTASCLLDCMVHIQYGIGDGTDSGSVYSVDPDNGYLSKKLFDVRDTGKIFGLAVNKYFTEMKSSSSNVYRGQPPGSYWQEEKALNKGLGLESYGSRQDGMFVYAGATGGGKIYVHAANSTDASEYQFVRPSSGSGSSFCTTYDTCFFDLALDGDDYAWIVNKDNNLYISANPQSSNWGGQVKYIGKIANMPSGGMLYGIAFDAKGNVYYAGYLDGKVGGFILQAKATDPLNAKQVFSKSDIAISDLASCAYPKVNTKALLG